MTYSKNGRRVHDWRRERMTDPTGRVDPRTKRYGKPKDWAHPAMQNARVAVYAWDGRDDQWDFYFKMRGK